MEVLRSRSSLKKRIQQALERKKTIGFVPTMGYLHAGHMSLVRRAIRENDIVVASIFVNPLQFGPKEDLKKYPRDLRRDTRMLRAACVDLLFAPGPADLYPPQFQTRVSVGSLADGLCGRSRPHHFGGVATVVLKLLQLVQPHKMYLGQKDFQQLRVIEQMVEDLDLSVRIVRCPTQREKDGLAMSSRNVYLTPQERREAPLLYAALRSASQMVQKGEKSAKKVRSELIRGLRKARSARIDYAEIVDAESLAPMVESKELPRRPAVLLAAALFFSKARLIDNILLKA